MIALYLLAAHMLWEHEPSTGPCFNTCVTTRVGPVDAYAWARP